MAEVQLTAFSSTPAGAMRGDDQAGCEPQPASTRSLTGLTRPRTVGRWPADLRSSVALLRAS